MLVHNLKERSILQELQVDERIIIIIIIIINIIIYLFGLNSYNTLVYLPINTGLS